MTRFRSLLLASCCLLAPASCKEEQTAAPPPPEVAVVEAKPQTVPLERELVGRLSPYRSADVRARVCRPDDSMLPKKGNTVRAVSRIASTVIVRGRGGSGATAFYGLAAARPEGGGRGPSGGRGVPEAGPRAARRG